MTFVTSALKANAADRAAQRKRYKAVATGAAAIAEALNPSEPFRINQMLLHLDIAPTSATDTLTVICNALAGGAYDTKILSNVLSVGSVIDLVYVPESDEVYDDGDVLDVAWQNTQTRTWGLTFIYEVV